jgi:hypothetical protein
MNRLQPPPSESSGDARSLRRNPHMDRSTPYARPTCADDVRMLCGPSITVCPPGLIDIKKRGRTAPPIRTCSER